MSCFISRRFRHVFPLINERLGNVGIREPFDVFPPGQSRAEPTMSRPTRCRNAAHTPMPELLGGTLRTIEGDVSKATAGRSLEFLLRLTIGSDTDLVKPSNVPLSLAQLLSPCFAFLPRRSLYHPSLYDYHILGSPPYADEEREGSHSSAERVVTVHCGGGAPRYTQASCISGGGSVTSQPEEEDADLVHK